MNNPSITTIIHSSHEKIQKDIKNLTSSELRKRGLIGRGIDSSTLSKYLPREDEGSFIFIDEEEKRDLFYKF